MAAPAAAAVAAQQNALNNGQQLLAARLRNDARNDRPDLTNVRSNFTQDQLAILDAGPPQCSQADRDLDNKCLDCRCPLSADMPPIGRMVWWRDRIFDLNVLNAYRQSRASNPARWQDPMDRSPITSRADFFGGHVFLQGQEMAEAMDLMQGYEERSERRDLYTRFIAIRDRCQQLERSAAERQVNVAAVVRAGGSTEASPIQVQVRRMANDADAQLNLIALGVESQEGAAASGRPDQRSPTQAAIEDTLNGDGWRRGRRGSNDDSSTSEEEVEALMQEVEEVVAQAVAAPPVVRILNIDVDSDSDEDVIQRRAMGSPEMMVFTNLTKRGATP